MIHVLLCCSNGMSTSILVKKMQAAALEKGMEAEIWAVSKVDLPAHMDKADIILLGPQIRFALNEIKNEVGESKPVDVIDIMDYGTMNGSKVLDLALQKLGK
ncbi:PTS sugar transporter subunit IIB [Anaerocolumna cellulosilytica]|uniref:PTS sugar transporter subunit IIB n=1 Tax=Anaerocolumna cellulosilytica TaxID=433286 RepID=A0A6S6QW50_9FIRM|nr:PTS sugar transporter subunit IIB [Anaerocolumna cellulosilytica]MBB5196674.1 PTS system cellobiose-specific IIB component [Anaerocolumna cellulosilytica]BCJ93936.1 PTS sugar transporter subunit IIB [Anaerocolumna cellulosilytica]